MSKHLKINSFFRIGKLYEFIYNDVDYKPHIQVVNIQCEYITEVLYPGAVLLYLGKSKKPKGRGLLLVPSGRIAFFDYTSPMNRSPQKFLKQLTKIR